MGCEVSADSGASEAMMLLAIGASFFIFLLLMSITRHVLKIRACYFD